MRIFILLLFTAFLLHCCAANSRDSVVGTTKGNVRGSPDVSDAGVPFLAFYGIPYAKPPVGSLRFQPPEESNTWNGIYEANKEPQPCIQLDYYRDFLLVGSEDCLYLNVFTGGLTKSDRSIHKRPVLVWIHGGAFKRGSTTTNLYGPRLLLDEDVVLVTIQYRIGSLGFLSTEDAALPGNYGLRDQNLALKWIQDNIAAFGGDANSVTIFGQSAGGASVHYHMLSPLSAGLFHKAISHSGTAFCYWAFDEQPKPKAIKLGKLLDCPTEKSNDLVKCLKTKTAEEIVRKHREFVEWSDDDPISPFGPVAETGQEAFLPGHPYKLMTLGQFNAVPWIVGATTSEAALRTSEIHQKPDVMRDLNERFNEVAPIILDYRHVTDDVEGTTQAIREFYFGDKAVNNETLDKWLQLYSDRFIVHGVYESAQIYAATSREPVYFYVFSFKGSDSIVTATHGELDTDYGVSHGDDLMHFFSGSVFKKLGKEEKKVSRHLIKMWKRFASTGEPTEDDSWTPIAEDTFAVMDINSKSTMTFDFPHERMYFWENLGLNDNKKQAKHDEL